MNTKRIVFISDTHNSLNRLNVPDGDILIHCGDATIQGTLPEITKFNAVLGELKKRFRHIIFVAGNHDALFQQEPNLANSLIGYARYLQDEEITVEGMRIYGSPWTPLFMNWSFMLSRGELETKWKRIPRDLDILITHGPPVGILDNVPRGIYFDELRREKTRFEHVGCGELRSAVLNKQPKIHAFGHIHYAYGTTEEFGIRFINAAITDDSYVIRNSPIVVDYDVEEKTVKLVEEE